MKRLKINNEYVKDEKYTVLEFDKIIKTNNSIIGIINNEEILMLNGINDFSIFSLDEGVEWDISDEELEDLQKQEFVKQLAQEKLKNIQKDNAITELTKELAKVKLDIIKLKGSAE